MGSLGVRMDVYGSTDVQTVTPQAGMVRVKGREKHLALAQSGLTISSAGRASGSDITELAVEWRDVIGCETDLTTPTSRSNGPSSAPPSTATMVVHYVEHKVKEKKIKAAKLKVRASRELVTGWAAQIQECCQKVPGRPHKLLTIINPISGQREGPKIFAKTIAPLYELAGIQNTAISTERYREAVELSENLDLDDYDGLVLLGGDGLYHEVLEGLTRQTQRRLGVNINDPDAAFAPIDLPIGVIPTGTGNAASRWANGITDVSTAILNVIRGQKQKAQISSVHSNGKLLRMSGVNVVYGMMSDMMKRTDELRWMKTKRYPYAMAAMVFGRKRLFDIKLQYKTSTGTDHRSQNNDGSQGLELTNSASLENENSSWQTYDPQGLRFRGLMSFSCDLDLSDSSRSESVQFLTGNSTPLIVDHDCFAPKFLKYLLNYISPVKSDNIPPKLQVLPNVTAYRLQLIENNEVQSGSCCCKRSPEKDRERERYAAMDGEVIQLEEPAMDVRVRRAFVPLYGNIGQTQDSPHTDGFKNKAYEHALED